MKTKQMVWLLFGGMAVWVLGCMENSAAPSKTQSPAERPTSMIENRRKDDSRSTDASKATAPNNTAINDRDRDGTTKTSFDQNENQADIDITADIRKQLVATTMSVEAQNVKVITQDGKVTLRGPVSSAEEKQTVEKIATTVAGKDKVDSHLEVDRK